MAGWHHLLNGHEFEQALGVGEGQRRLACCSPRVRKESDVTEQLNWTEKVLIRAFKDDWSQISITKIITMKKFEIWWELPKMWHRDMKWVNAAGKLAPIDSSHARLLQIFSVWKTQHLWSTIKQHISVFSFQTP